MSKPNMRINAARKGGHRLIAFRADDLSIKAATGEGETKGPPTFSMVAYTGGALTLDGWQHPVVIEQSGWENLDRKRPALRGHDPDKIVGHIDHSAVEGKNLIASGVVSGNNDHAEEVINTHADGFPWQASVGADAKEVDFVPEGESAQANGRTWQGPINISRRTSLNEISFVPNGADDDTSASVAAKAAGSIAMTNFQRWAKAHGYDIDKIDDVQMTALKEAFKAMCPEVDPDAEAEEQEDDEDGEDGSAEASDDGDMDGDGEAEDEDEDEPDADPKKRGKAKAAGKNSIIVAAKATAAKAMVVEVRRVAAAESKRINRIRTLCAGKHGAIEAKAIEKGWSVERTELRVLRASRPTPNTPNGAFGINTGRGFEMSAKILVAAASRNAGVPDKYALSDLNDKEKQIATSERLRSATSSLYSIAATVAQFHGKRIPTFRMDKDAIIASFEIDRSITASARASMIEADGGTGFTTMSLPGITENVLNKQMLAAYQSVPTVVPDVAYETSTNDFKPWKRYRLTAGGNYAEVGPDGQLKHLQLTDETYGGEAQTQGGVLAITRQMWMNDDMGALVQLPMHLGRLGGIARERAVIAVLLAGSTTTAPGADDGNTPNAYNLFSAGANNYLTGATSALGITGMSNAEQAFVQQKDKLGNPIFVVPDRILVPPALKTAGFNLYNGASLVVSALGSTSSEKVEPNLNAFTGKFKVLTSPFLGSASPLGNSSDTAWWLLADPQMGMAVVAIAYVNNQRAPIIQRGELNFDQLGMGLRSFWDFGAAGADARCGVLSAGA